MMNMVKALQCSVCFKAAKTIETAFAHACTPQSNQSGLFGLGNTAASNNKAKTYFIIDVD
jgi:hypothetical protein